MSFSFGREFRLTIFGESHGMCVGAVVDGCPAGLPVSESEIQAELDRRKPGGRLYSARLEGDRVRILSGIFRGRTNGGPIAMEIENEDTDDAWYEENRYTPRPGHSDYTAYIKYGGANDYRGGGFFSGRMTAGLVMGGAIAKRVLATAGVRVIGHTVQVGRVALDRSPDDREVEGEASSSPVRCVDEAVSREMEAEIEDAARSGDSVGGIVECRVLGLPAGVGEPFFDPIEGVVAHGIFSIPGVKAVEFGAGFELSSMRGSEANDEFAVECGSIITRTNNSGGVLGGISTGMPLTFRVGIKPTPSIRRTQTSVDLRDRTERLIAVGGRHDPCIAVRAVPVIEAVAALCIADLMIRGGMIPRKFGDGVAKNGD